MITWNQFTPNVGYKIAHDRIKYKAPDATRGIPRTESGSIISFYAFFVKEIVDIDRVFDMYQKEISSLYFQVLFDFKVPKWRRKMLLSYQVIILKSVNGGLCTNQHS